MNGAGTIDPEKVCETVENDGPDKILTTSKVDSVRKELNHNSNLEKPENGPTTGYNVSK